MATNTPILLTGATGIPVADITAHERAHPEAGYIGGAVLSHLLKHQSRGTFDITVLVRSASKAKILESKFGVKTVLGTHQELDKVEGLVEHAHIIFHLADADDEPLIKAILSGARKRYATLGDLPILIHTSGTGTLTDNARGEYATDTVYDDLSVDQIKSIPDTAAHRNVDLLITEADKQGYVRAYIVLPSTIYGIATHALVDAGVSNPISQQIPALVRAALDRKRAGVVGKGRALWPDVHIDDIADLYIVLFDSIVSNPEKIGHGWEGFYFGENGEHSWYQISKAIGDALVHFGIATESDPTPFTAEELVNYFGSEKRGYSYGSNSRCRANRSRSIGWKPKYLTEDMIKSIVLEVEALSAGQ